MIFNTFQWVQCQKQQVKHSQKGQQHSSVHLSHSSVAGLLWMFYVFWGALHLHCFQTLESARFPFFERQQVNISGLFSLQVRWWWPRRWVGCMPTCCCTVRVSSTMSTVWQYPESWRIRGLKDSIWKSSVAFTSHLTLKGEFISLFPLTFIPYLCYQYSIFLFFCSKTINSLNCGLQIIS